VLDAHTFEQLDSRGARHALVGDDDPDLVFDQELQRTIGTRASQNIEVTFAVCFADDQVFFVVVNEQ
jgi:hypothetical protein